MTILKYFGSHFSDLGACLWDNIEQAGGRLKFVTQSGFVLCHKALLVTTFPTLTKLLCTECDSKADDSVIIAPDADIDQIIAAIDIFYKSGDTEQLNNVFKDLFAVADTGNPNYLENESEVENVVNTEENLCRTISIVEPLSFTPTNIDDHEDNDDTQSDTENVSQLKNNEETIFEEGGVIKSHNSTEEFIKKETMKRKNTKFRNVRFLSDDFLAKSLPDGTSVYLCNKCGKGCSNMSGAARHSFFCSRGQKVVNNHICESCGKIFKTRKLLSAHVEKHTEKGKQLNNFPCDQCGKYFKRKKLLDLHNETHTTGLDIHIKIHTDSNKIKSKTCNFCGKIFKKKKWLNTHIRKHTERKQIKEEPNTENTLAEDGREESFPMDKGKTPLGDFLARHLENGRLVYQCRKCLKSCRNTSGASRHAAFCKKETFCEGVNNPLPCELCTKVCLSTKGLTWHMKQVHS